MKHRDDESKVSLKEYAVDTTIGAFTGRYTRNVLQMSPMWTTTSGPLTFSPSNFITAQVEIMPVVLAGAVTRAGILGKNPTLSVKNALAGTPSTVSWAVFQNFLMSTPMGQQLFPGGLDSGLYMVVDGVLSRTRTVITDYYNPQ